MSFSKKTLIAGMMLFGALTLYVAPVFAAGSAMTQTKSYCWLEKDCKASNGTFSSSVKSGDCLPNYGYCYPKEEAVNLQIPIGSLTNASSLSQYIPAIYNYLVAIVGIVAIVMIMIGGLQYLTAGSSGRVGEAKSRIMSAIIGLIITLSAYTILQTINPATLQFATSLKIKMVAPQWAAQWCPNTTIKGTDYTGEFLCGKKYGPNDTTTGKTGKTVPLTSGYCNGASCDKDSSGGTLACTKLSYSGVNTPKCVTEKAAKICELIKSKGSSCPNTAVPTRTAVCQSEVVITIASYSQLTSLGIKTSYTDAAFGGSKAAILTDKDGNQLKIDVYAWKNASINNLSLSPCAGGIVGCDGADSKFIADLCQQLSKLPTNSKLLDLFQ